MSTESRGLTRQFLLMVLELVLVLAVLKVATPWLMSGQRGSVTTGIVAGLICVRPRGGKGRGRGRGVLNLFRCLKASVPRRAKAARLSGGRIAGPGLGRWSGSSGRQASRESAAVALKRVSPRVVYPKAP